MNSHNLIKASSIYLVVLSNCIFADGSAPVYISNNIDSDQNIVISRAGDDGPWWNEFRYRVYAGDDNCQNPEVPFPITLKPSDQKQFSLPIGYNHYCHYNLYFQNADLTCDLYIASAGDGDGAFKVPHYDGGDTTCHDHSVTPDFGMTGNVVSIKTQG